MAKKIAFMAFCGYNYGSTLQSLGLFTSIKKLGYTCEVIGWREFFNKIESVDTPRLEPHDKKEDQAFMKANFQNFSVRHFCFNQHLGNIPVNAKLHTFKQILLMQYSAFIGGSDQIWKPGSFWFKAKRYLQFAPEAKRIAYAPSVGWDKIPLSAVGNIPQWRRWLASIPYRSCREASGSAIVGHLVGKPVPTVVDPTFLLRPEDWRMLLKNEGVVSPEIEKILASGKPYMVAYLLDHYDIYKEYVEKLASRLSLELVWLTGRGDVGPIQRNCALTDPAGFVKLIDRASFICADGFHGCCFSLNFSKPFVLLCAQKQNNNDSRMQDLFTRFGVTGRVVFPEDDPSALDIEMDYAKIQKNIENARQKSIAFLSESLASASQGSGMLPVLYEKFKTRLLKKFKQKKGFVRTVQRIPLDNPNNCTGCAACMNMCPKDAISMNPNQDGFLMPVVDEQKCILCGKCLNLCPLRKRPNIGPYEEVKEVYAAWIKDKETLSRSASGGIFPLLAEKTFAQGGVVYGAAWDKNDWSLHTVCATNMEEARPIQGSKYVQAETGFVFREIKEKLKTGIPILFTGTSCQVGGLYAYLGGNHNLLTTVDLICSGVPSPAFFKKYIKWREELHDSSITSFEFRSKKNGWGGGIEFCFYNGISKMIPLHKDEYGHLFINHFIQRPSCFVCKFRGTSKRLADITIGDFWGIGQHDIPFEHEKSQGVSVVLSNTTKGKAIIETLFTDEKQVFAEKRPLSEVLPGNAWLTKNYGKRSDYDELMKLLREKNFEEAFDTYFGDKTIREHLD